MLLPLAGSIVPFLLAFAVDDFAGRTEASAAPMHTVLDAETWSGIRAARDAQERGVVAVADGHAAHHSAQPWHSAFDGRGVTIRPDDGAWTWGLALERWGFDGALREVGGFAAGCAEGERVEYAWNASLTEWYVNGASGLEHGYTVHCRPDGHRRPDGEGALVFELAVRGDLEPRCEADGRGARFVDAAGSAVLLYSGLAVFDATGRALDAQLDAHANGLRIAIDERDARYPLTIDPIVQQAYLKASNTGFGDTFGWAAAISGETVVVGAPSEDSNATGVDGNQADDSAGNSGAAYVFVRNGATWSQQAYLKASNTGGGDVFGQVLAISGNTIVVGAPAEDSGATGVGGDQADNSVGDAGAAYVFVRNGTTWSQQAYLKASNPGLFDTFGGAVAVTGDTLVIGAQGEDSNSSTIDAGQADNSLPSSGAAYVFVRSGTTWSQQAYLKATNPGNSDFFGTAVSVSGDTVVVGANSEDSMSSTIDAGGADNTFTDAGAAYVFVRNGATWSSQAYLKASNCGPLDGFGFSVAISGETAVVGALAEDSNSNRVNEAELDDSAPSAGAAYVFVRNGATWTQQAYLKATNSDANDRLGWSVAVDGDTVVAGATDERGLSPGVNGDQTDNSANSAGAAYVFVRSGTTWTQRAYCKASNPDAFNSFGKSVSVSGSTIVVGTPSEDSSATGVNGDPWNHGIPGSGAAYVFHPPIVPDPAPYCFGDGSGTACPCSPVPVPHGFAGRGCPSNNYPGGAMLDWSGAASLSGDTLVLTATDVFNGGGCLVFQGTTDEAGGLGAVFGDGLRCAAGTTTRMRTHTVVQNMYEYPDPTLGDNPISIRGAVTVPGSIRYYQGWYRSANPAFCTSATFNLTNGVRVAWSP